MIPRELLKIDICQGSAMWQLILGASAFEHPVNEDSVLASQAFDQAFRLDT